MFKVSGGSLALAVALVAAAMSAPLAVASGDGGPCSSTRDCGYLGDCVANRCVCDSGWGGIGCASLLLAPAPPNAGLRQNISSNWCGTILEGPNAGTWTMLSSDMSNCTLNVWLSGSQVIVATGASPMGPFTPTGALAVHSEAHNPQAVLAPDGTYLLFDSYGGPDGGCPSTANISTCKGGPMCPPKMPKAGGVASWVFHKADTPVGPWSPVHTTVDFPCYSENLTPSPAFLPDGSLLLVFHCDTAGNRSMGDLVLVRSPDWRTQPFARLGDVAWHVCGNGPANSTCVEPHPEDPFLFTRTSPRDGSLSLHIILHNTPRGIHLFSSDGGASFTLQQALGAGGVPVAPFVYEEVIEQVGSAAFTCQRRERPWLLLGGSHGAPTALVTAVQASSVHSGTFTHVQPIEA